MIVVSDIKKMRYKRAPIIIAAGFFDGVHLGHQKVINKAITRARDIHGKAWVLTFDKHPMEILHPHLAPHLLSSNQHKLRMLEREHIDGCLLLPFTKTLANMTPEEFAYNLKHHIPAFNEIMVGKNWTFGKRGKGKISDLRRLAKTLGFSATVVTPVTRGGKTISSTLVRAAIKQGNLDDATSMLGHPFSVFGKVIKGRSVGRQMGYPTANIDFKNEIIPPKGVYAVIALIANKTKTHNHTQLATGVANLGIHPTFSDNKQKEPVLELHVMNKSDDWYNNNIELFFIEKIRNEKQFASPKHLKEQIGMDIYRAEKILKKNKRTLYRTGVYVL